MPSGGKQHKVSLPHAAAAIEPFIAAIQNVYNLSPGAGGTELRQHLLVASKLVDGTLLPSLQLCAHHAHTPSDVLTQLLHRCLSLLATITFNSEGSHSELVLRSGVLLQLLQGAGASLQQRRVAAQLFRAVINMDLLKPPPPALAPAAAALREATMALISKLEVNTSSALANELDSRSDLVLDRSGALDAARARRRAAACSITACLCCRRVVRDDFGGTVRPRVPAGAAHGRASPAATFLRRPSHVFGLNLSCIRRSS